MRAPGLAVGLVVAASGCANLLGIEDVTRRDAGEAPADVAADDAATIDAMIVERCDWETVLAEPWKPVAMVSSGLVGFTTTAGGFAGTIDATAGGPQMAAQHPYIYINLRTGVKVGVDDIAARLSFEWDIALKRNVILINGGDSGHAGVEAARITATSLAEVTSAPAIGYSSDRFADPACGFLPVPDSVGEPSHALQDWWDRSATPLAPADYVYVLRRPGWTGAFRVASYFGNPSMPTQSAYYQVEWKTL